MKWNRVNIARISLVGKKNSITCNCCKVSETWEQSAQFTTLMRPSLKTKGKTEIRIATPDQQLRYFIDQHLEAHAPKKVEAAEAVAV